MYVSLATASATRKLLLWRHSGLGSIARNLSTSWSLSNWRNETPAGGLTEVYVYTPESQTVWPDPTLGVFAPNDPKFTFPGHVGLVGDDEKVAETKNAGAEDNLIDETKAAVNQTVRVKLDVLEDKTTREHQAQTLYSAHDYIHFTTGSDGYVCSNPVLLETFPSTFSNMEGIRFELHETPQLLKKEVEPLFPGVTAFTNPGGPLSVITMARETRHDMSTWSDIVEEERDLLTGQFVSLAKEICGRLKSDGYWADFIDPASGIPYFGAHTNTTLFETDDKYRLLGFRIEDLGCCKVICHRDFGRHVFVGTIFTAVSTSSGTIQDLFKELLINDQLMTFNTSAATSADDRQIVLKDQLENF